MRKRVELLVVVQAAACLALGALLTRANVASAQGILPVPPMEPPQRACPVACGWRVGAVAELAFIPFRAGAAVRVEAPVGRMLYNVVPTVAFGARWQFLPRGNGFDHLLSGEIDAGLRVGLREWFYLHLRAGLGVGGFWGATTQTALTPAVSTRWGIHGYFGRAAWFSVGVDFVLSTTGDNGFYLVPGIHFG